MEVTDSLQAPLRLQSVSAKHCVDCERAVTQSVSGQDDGDEQFAEIWPVIGTSGVKSPFHAMSLHVQVESVAC